MISSKIPAFIGVVHLLPLPGSPRASALHPNEAVRLAGVRAVQEARALVQAGFQAIILENFGDTPFFKNSVPPETLASMAFIAAAVREAVDLPIGINVLRNDARTALAIAAVTGCEFIRVNVLAGVSATDQGLIEGCAAELLRERDLLGADVAILADAHVKHARSLSSEDLALEIEDLALRSGADGVIITGSTTGRSVSEGDLRSAAEVMARHRIPVWVGSGVTSENGAEIVGLGFGVIIGSDLREKGRAGAPLNLSRMRECVKSLRAGGKRPVRKKKKAVRATSKKSAVAKSQGKKSAAKKKKARRK